MFRWTQKKIWTSISIRKKPIFPFLMVSERSEHSTPAYMRYIYQKPNNHHKSRFQKYCLHIQGSVYNCFFNTLTNQRKNLMVKHAVYILADLEAQSIFLSTIFKKPNLNFLKRTNLAISNILGDLFRHYNTSELKKIDRNGVQ